MKVKADVRLRIDEWAEVILEIDQESLDEAAELLQTSWEKDKEAILVEAISEIITDSAPNPWPVALFFEFNSAKVYHSGVEEVRDIQIIEDYKGGPDVE